MLPRFELLVAAAPVVGASDLREELMRRPLALAPLPGARTVLGEVSPAAEAQAVRPGLALGEAFARCPQLELVTPDPVRAEDAWERVLQAVEGIGAEVEPGRRPGELFFESAGLEPLHRGLDGVIAALRDAVGRPLRIGAGPTRFVAHAAARRARPRRPLVIRDDTQRRDFLAPAPVGWLATHSEQCAALVDQLQQLGITTLGEFALLRRRQIAERFGRAGLVARDLVHGVEPALRPRRPVRQIREQVELIDDAAPQQDEQAALAADLERALDLLVERLLAGRERAGRTLRSLVLGANLVGGGSWSVRVVLREPTADVGRIVTALQPKLGELPRQAASLTLTAEGFGPPEHRVETLFDEDAEEQRAARLKSAAEQARRAAGSPQKLARVLRLQSASRIPERRTALSPGPQPLQLPQPVAVVAGADGRPTQVRGRAVEAERERWVVEDAWWTARPLRRCYFELVLEGGACVVVFEDLASRRWFRQSA